jgi:hypothetical protein
MISKAWYVQCDSCGDPAPISCEGRKQALEYAKIEAGFISKEGKDICPRCREIKVIPIQ